MGIGQRGDSKSQVAKISAIHRKRSTRSDEMLLKTAVFERGRLVRDESVRVGTLIGFGLLIGLSWWVNLALAKMKIP